MSRDIGWVTAGNQRPVHWGYSRRHQAGQFLGKAFPCQLLAVLLALMVGVACSNSTPTADVEPVVTQEQFHALHNLAETSVYVDPQILTYVTEIVRSTREHPRVSVGSSPRGGLSLLKAGRALALTYGRDFITPDDIKLIANDVLAHRLILNIEDILEGLSQESVVQEVVGQIEVPTEFRPTS